MRLHLGKRFAPPRFVAFLVAAAAGMAFGVPRLGWEYGSMAGFDAAAILFFALAYPLLDDRTNQMREAARRNDANRGLLLAITAMVSLVVLAAVASVMGQAGKPKPAAVALIVATLALSWMFSSLIYALHYAHLFYGDDGGRDAGGITFPGTKEPDYWDFLYFSTCLSMTFQVSDMTIESGRVRRTVMAHCLAAFVFNLGILAFTINSLGG